MFITRSPRRSGFALALPALIAAFFTMASSTATGRVAVTARAAPGDLAVAGGGLGIAATSDPSLASPGGADLSAAGALAQATGVPLAGDDPHAWEVGGHGVLGYSAADGRFCFVFRDLTGGCIGAGALTDALPLDITTDYGPGTFRVYGLALDGVTAVTVRVAGLERPAAFAHNAFFFSDAALGGTAGISGELVASFRDGSSRTQPFRVLALVAG